MSGRWLRLKERVLGPPLVVLTLRHQDRRDPEAAAALAELERRIEDLCFSRRALPGPDEATCRPGRATVWHWNRADIPLPQLGNEAVEVISGMGHPEWDASLGGGALIGP